MLPEWGITTAALSAGVAFLANVVDLLEAVCVGAEDFALLQVGGYAAGTASLVPLLLFWLKPDVVVASTFFLSFWLVRLAVYLPKVRLLASYSGKEQTVRPLSEVLGPLYLQDVLTVAVTEGPAILLGAFGSLGSVGVFQLGTRIMWPARNFVGQLTAVLLPRVSATRMDGLTRDEKLLALFGVPVLAGFAVATHVLALLVLPGTVGSGYEEATAVVTILAWLLPLDLIFNLIGVGLLAREMDRRLLSLAIPFSVLLLFACAVGSQRGAVGLAIAMVASGIVNMTYHLPLYGRWVGALGVRSAFLALAAVIVLQVGVWGLDIAAWALTLGGAMLGLGVMALLRALRFCDSG